MWRYSPWGDHTTRSPRGHVIGNEGVVFHSMQDLRAVGAEVSAAHPRRAGPPENPQPSLRCAQVPSLIATPIHGAPGRAPCPSSLPLWGTLVPSPILQMGDLRHRRIQ